MANQSITIRINDVVREKLELLRDKRGFSRLNDTVIYAIMETYNSEVDNYREILKKRQPREVLSPEEKVKREAERESAKRTAKEVVMVNAARDICLLLEGTEVNNANGTFGCEYKLYEKVGRRVLVGKRIVPYDLLTSEHVSLQYKGGTKEEIDQLVDNEIEVQHATAPRSDDKVQ